MRIILTLIIGLFFGAPYEVKGSHHPSGLERLLASSIIKDPVAHSDVDDFYKGLGANTWEGVSMTRAKGLSGDRFHGGEFSDTELDQWFIHGFLNEAIFALTGIGPLKDGEEIGRSDNVWTNSLDRTVFLLYYADKNGFIPYLLTPRQKSAVSKTWKDGNQRKQMPPAPPLIRLRDFSALINYPNNHEKEVFFMLPDPDEPSFKTLFDKVTESISRTRTSLSENPFFLALGRLFSKQKLFVENIEKFRTASYATLEPADKETFKDFYENQGRVLDAIQVALFQFIGATISDLYQSKEVPDLKRYIPKFVTKVLISGGMMGGPGGSSGAGVGVAEKVAAEVRSLGHPEEVTGGAGSGVGLAERVASEPASSSKPFWIEFDSSTPQAFLNNLHTLAPTITYTSIGGVVKTVPLDLTTQIEDLDRTKPTAITIKGASPQSLDIRSVEDIVKIGVKASGTGYHFDVSGFTW
jgi:hypothetical protein